MNEDVVEWLRMDEDVDDWLEMDENVDEWLEEIKRHYETTREHRRLNYLTVLEKTLIYCEDKLTTKLDITRSKIKGVKELLEEHIRQENKKMTEDI